MTSKTISLSGTELKVNYSGGANVWLRNDGTSAVYASAAPDIAAGADDVVSIPAGQAAPIYGANGTVYLLGTGSVMLIGSDYAQCPFKTSTSSGGSGGVDDVARAAINAHEGNAEMHVTAAEKEHWDAKADKSDIPTELPADGGNADTVDGLHDKDLCRLIDVIGGIKNGCASEASGTIMIYGDRSVAKTNNKLAYFGWTLDSEGWFTPLIVSQYVSGTSYNIHTSAASYEEGVKNYSDKVAAFEYRGRNYFACWQNSSSYQNPQVSGGYKIEFSGDYISMCEQLIDYCESLTLDGKHASDFAIYKGYPEGGDCNNADKQGVYSVSANSANAPGSKYYTIIVDAAGNGDWITQTAITAETDPRIHRRVRINNVWGEWKNIADGGNAASVGAYTEAKIAALEARIAALEGSK